MSDIIPFHVQLSGPLSSVKKFLMFHEGTTPQPPSTKRTSKQCYPRPEPSIKVYLLRQASIETRGRKTSRNSILAEGQLREMPPAHASCESQDMIQLDWQGELRCGSDVSVGGFIASNIGVKVCEMPRLLMTELTRLGLLGLHWYWGRAS